VAHLEFDAINDNVQEMIDYYGHNSRKISCDVYIDDRSLNPITSSEFTIKGGNHNGKRI
jgi:hypothetical protein